MKDRIPPHNEEAEVATLGAILLDPNAFDVVIPILRADDFYKAAHKIVFEAVGDLKNSGKEIDIITLADALTTSGKLEMVGGYGWVSNLTSSVPSTANVEYYAKIVKDAAIRRNLITVANEIVATGFDDRVESRALIEEAEKKIFELAEQRQTNAYKSAKDVIPLVVERIQKLYKTKEPITGLPTGFRDLDFMTTGFHKSELIIIAARPSIGKTTFALNIAAHMAIHKKIPVGFFTLEMPDVDLYDRILASEAHIDSNKVRTGFLKPGDFQNIKEVIPQIYDAPLYSDDTPSMKLLDLRAQARRMKSKHDIQILFVDYISLITHENAMLPRHEQVAEFSRSLKALARELQIPVVALSQLTRDTENKPPTLANLRESGSLEQDADVVLFLHRQRGTERDKDQGPMPLIETELIIGKQRKGPVGTVKLAFFPQYTRFDNFTDEEQ